MSSFHTEEQDLTPLQSSTENNTETAAIMDEEVAEVDYVAHNNNSTENNRNPDNDTAQRNAELVFSIIMLVLGLALEFAGITPNQRPIPAQQLQTGEFFYNLTNNELFNGQTVPGECLLD